MGLYSYVLTTVFYIHFDIFKKLKYFNLIYQDHHHHHQFLLLLVEHRASLKSFQALRSPAICLTSFHDLVLLISSFIVLHHVLFSLPHLLYPSNLSFCILDILTLILFVLFMLISKPTNSASSFSLFSFSSISQNLCANRQISSA